MIAQQNKYCGVDRWHKAGITGKGIVIWNMENNRADHGKMTTTRVKHAAPDSEVINTSLSMSSDASKVKYSYAVLDDGTKIDVEEFIKTRNIKLITRSVGGGTAIGGVESQFWNDLKKRYNLIFFNSAGNDGSDGAGGSLPPDVAIYVAACGLDRYGKPQRDNYSAIGSEVDFIDFRGFYSGTSFAAPYLCGKAALLVQKYGKQITQDEVYEYFKAHAEDVEEEGLDNKSGWGIPIMGKTQTEIKMRIGKKEATVDGKKVILDVAPKIENQRTLIPVRFVSESMGLKVEWDEKTKEITIVR